jgi:hypothetical protein
VKGTPTRDPPIDRNAMIALRITVVRITADLATVVKTIVDLVAVVRTPADLVAVVRTPPDLVAAEGRTRKGARGAPASRSL